MKSQIRQVLFLAIFGLLCTVFVFFVPWGKNSPISREMNIIEQNNQDKNSDFSS